MTFLASNYWEERYALGGNSGSGSQGDLAQAKADYINALIRQRNVKSVVDWGCGDGVLLSLLDLETVAYLGVDVSASAIRMCAEKRPEVSLLLWREGPHIDIQADLAMSIDILFHFPDDAEYERYLRTLFFSSTRYVLIHNAETGPEPGPHVRWRPVSEDVQRLCPGWKIVDTAPGVNGCEFTLYR